MTSLEHLIENCLYNIEAGNSYKVVLADIKNDPNLKYAGITAEQCWEICQYVYFTFIKYNYEKIDHEDVYIKEEESDIDFEELWEELTRRIKEDAN